LRRTRLRIQRNNRYFEIAHAHGLGYEQYGREQAEVLVGCVISGVLPRNAARTHA